MRVGIAGSAGIEGLTETAGIMSSDNGAAHPVVKRAAIIWGVALLALVFFHVGGTRL